MSECIRRELARSTRTLQGGRRECGDLVEIFIRERARVEQRVAVGDAGEHRHGGPRPQHVRDAPTPWQRDGERRDRARRVGAAADERLARHDLGIERVEPFSQNAGELAELFRLTGDRAERRDVADRIAVAMDAQRRLERGQRELVAAERAVERMRPYLAHEITVADDDPALRTAEQLVARVAHQRRSGADAVDDARLERERLGHVLGEQPGAEILEHQHAARGAQLDELRERRHRREAEDPEIARVDLEQHARVRPDRSGIVAQVRAVRRADLDHPAAGLRHHVGHAKAAADLDELAAGHDDLALVRQRAQHEVDRRSVVVHHERRLGPAQLGRQRADAFLALVALAGERVDLDDRVAGRIGDRRARRGGERRTADAGVEHHAGGVDDPAMAHRTRRTHALGERDGDVGHPRRVDRTRREPFPQLVDQ